jgi:hypothetical protein
VKLGLSSVNCAVPDQRTDFPEHLVRGPSPEKDRTGLKRDMYYFLGWQFAIIGILYVSPESFSGWSKEQKEEKDFGAWWDHVTKPVWDSDDDFVNYVLHPYWGAAYYVRARERGYGGRSAFWYSVMLSSMYEFGVEAVFENPSIQDLVVTPLVGSWVGVRFVKARKNIRARVLREGRYRRGDRWWLALTDPLGGINRFTDRVLRYDADVQIRPFVARESALGGARGAGDNDRNAFGDTYYGLRMSLQW